MLTSRHLLNLELTSKQPHPTQQKEIPKTVFSSESIVTANLYNDDENVNSFVASNSNLFVVSNCNFALQNQTQTSVGLNFLSGLMVLEIFWI